MIEGGIAQAVPEHPKRDHIFALSTAFGDAYLFQVSKYSQFYPPMHREFTDDLTTLIIKCQIKYDSKNIWRDIVGPNSNHNSRSNISLDIPLIH